MSYENNVTAYGYTDTAEGPVQHYPCDMGGHKFNAPVMVSPRMRGDRTKLYPKRTGCGTKYLHALPGGGVIAGQRV